MDSRENGGITKGDRKVWFPKQREDYKIDPIFKIFRVYRNEDQN